MTPQLRFQEFTDDWQVKKLGEVVDNVGGTALESHVNPAGSHKFISIGNYSTDGRYTDNGQRIILNDKTITKLLNENDIAMVLNDKTASGDIIGSSILINENDRFIYNQRTERLVPRKTVSPRFLWLQLNSTSFRKKVFSIAQGGTQIYVNYPSVKKLQMTLPSKPEQEKIADFLTAVDERIGVSEKKLELLETYKRGVMQQIFSQKIRFKDENGKPYPDWKEKKLGEIGKVITGKTPSTSEKSHWLGKVKFVTPTDMDGKKHQETSSRSVSYTGSLLLPEKSIMYTCIASIGKMSMSVGETITNQQINSFIPSKEICNDFAYYNLLWLTPRIVATQSNNTLPIINKSEFSKFKLLVPAKEEQQKIADFLTTLDEKITAEKSKLTATREFKKALLQRMFV